MACGPQEQTSVMPSYWQACAFEAEKNRYSSCKCTKSHASTCIHALEPSACISVPMRVVHCPLTSQA
eukprot:6214425-Pleurochrysis_carterae.AAC.2